MARRRFNVFNLSFLDVMSCGLGAVVLFFMIVNAQVSSRAGRANVEVQAETDRLEEEILEGRKDLVRARNILAARTEEQVATEGEARRVKTLLETLEQELAELDQNSLAQEDSIEDLKADIERLENARERLSADAADPSRDTGQRIRSFIGDGNRQYLTGIRMGGRRVLILLDASTSMLGRTYVNVLRFRNLPPEDRKRAPKWRQAVRTVDWLTTQILPGAQFQIFAFNETAGSVLPDTQGDWLEVTDGNTLTRAVEALQDLVPEKGTSLANAFAAAEAMDPPPDNIFLITDGLPTQGKTPPGKTQSVKPERRAALFTQAIRNVPRRAPVNVMLLPMDGDPAAPGLFWGLALSTGGSMLTPARDWP